jgi:hypothetical protein
LVGIWLEIFGSPKLQNLNRDVVVDVVVIHHRKEVVGEERKITQMVSGHGMAGIGVVDKVDPLQ